MKAKGVNVTVPEALYEKLIQRQAQIKRVTGKHAGLAQLILELVAKGIGQEGAEASSDKKASDKGGSETLTNLRDKLWEEKLEYLAQKEQTLSQLASLTFYKARVKSLEDELASMQESSASEDDKDGSHVLEMLLPTILSIGAACWLNNESEKKTSNQLAELRAKLEESIPLMPPKSRHYVQTVLGAMRIPEEKLIEAAKEKANQQGLSLSGTIW